MTQALVNQVGWRPVMDGPLPRANHAAVHTQGLKYVKSGTNPTSLRTGMSKAVKMIADKIPSLARCAGCPVCGCFNAWDHGCSR
jgi:hypothetical protein